MPASGMLFANDHDAGRTFIFDVRDPLHPQIVTSFTDMDGYMHPHSYLRLPNGHVLVSFQHAHANMDKEQIGGSGGLVEIDDQGKVIRSASSADPAFPNALLEPYSLVVLPGIDRVVVTNSSMHEENVFSGVTYQVFRLSDLKLMKTAYLDMGENHYGHVSPEEPRLGPNGVVYVQTLGCGIERISNIDKDEPSAKLVYPFPGSFCGVPRSEEPRLVHNGVVYVQTLGCGIERISNIDKDEPSAKLVYTFPGSFCGVPTIVGHYLIQSVPLVHGVIALDIANGMKPVEASRLTIDNTFFSHWTGWDEKRSEEH